MTPANDNGPRLLTKQQAAEYCGVSTPTFGKWVLSGQMPAPYRATRKFDRKAIDAMLDKNSGIGVPEKEDSLDRWLREKAEKAASGRR